MEKEKQLQHKYAQMQMLDQQIKQTQKQVQMLDQQRAEIMMAMQALEEIKDAKKGSEILMPIASGIFAKAELKDCSELVLNVGANTAVVKDVQGTKKILETQAKEMSSVQQKLTEELQQMVGQARKLEAEINKLSS